MFQYARAMALNKKFTDEEVKLDIHCFNGYTKHKGFEINRRTTPTLFCVFSNDIRWCKENIEPLLNGKETIYVDWNTGTDNFRDMQLMTKCKHCIIANSSFSWWGAWLNNNKDKIVIAPRIWYNTKEKVSPVANSWIKL